MRSCFAKEEQRIEALYEQGFVTLEEANRQRRELGIDFDVQNHDPRAYEVEADMNLYKVCHDERQEDWDSYGKYVGVDR